MSIVSFIAFIHVICRAWFLARRPAGWLASWLAGWLAGWLASWLAGWLSLGFSWRLGG